MNESTYNLLIIIMGAILSGVLYLDHKKAIALKDMVPQSFAEIGISLARDLAKRTANPDDDEIVEKIADALIDKGVVVAQKYGVDGKP